MNPRVVVPVLALTGAAVLLRRSAALQGHVQAMKAHIDKCKQIFSGEGAASGCGAAAGSCE